MGPFRVLQISIVVLMLFGSTWLVRAVGMAGTSAGSSSTWLGSSDALAGVLQQGDNGDNDDDDDDNGDNDDAGDDNGNTNNNGNTNTNDNDDGGDDNDNDSDDDNDNFADLDDLFPERPAASEPRRPPEPECSTPGQETVFTSRDEKVAVRIFANSPRVRIEIYQVIDFLAAPLPPGSLVGLLAYEIRASYCDTNPLLELPAEANLSIRYNDIEATGLDENRFVIGRLDLATGTWSPVDKRANDPAANYTTATISQTGFYMVWETR
jgi:hypothetical protein